jgi:hypothetical protein
MKIAFYRRRIKGVNDGNGLTAAIPLNRAKVDVIEAIGMADLRGTVSCGRGRDARLDQKERLHS